MHIGRLSAKLTPGEFLVEDLVDRRARAARIGRS